MLLVLRDQEPFGTAMEIVGGILVVIGALDARFASWRSRVLQALGDASYSLYLTHIFTLGALRVVWGWLLPAPPTLATTIAFMLLSLVVVQRRRLAGLSLDRDAAAAAAPPPPQGPGAYSRRTLSGCRYRLLHHR